MFSPSRRSCSLFSLTLHNFLTPGNLVALVRSVSILGILGLGMGLVVIGRGIDLAMVATMVVAVSWVLSLATHQHVPLGWALLIGAAFSVVAGLVSGVLIAYAVVPAIFTTLAMGLVIYGVGRAWLFEVDVQNTPNDSAFFQFLSDAKFFGLPLPIVLFALLRRSFGPSWGGRASDDISTQAATIRPRRATPAFRFDRSSFPNT